jgi:23S rRNA (uracil1939-C5)-methyltransferase
MDGPVELRIEKIAALGEAAATWKDQRVFIHGCAPGELVRVRLGPPRGGYARAELLEVLEPSPARVSPACPLYGSCGGCSLQHLNDVAQREVRLGLLREALARSGLADAPEPAFRPGPGLGYRNRFRFSGTPSGPGLLMASSSRVISLPSCPVAVPEVEAFLGREAGGGEGAIGPGQRRLVFGSQMGLFIEGRDSLARARVLERDFAFPAGGFFQSNLAVLGALVSDLDRGLGGDRLADLYGGAGVFSAFLSSKASSIQLVEEDPASAAAARANVPGPARLDVAAMRVEDWIKLPAAARPFDAILVDPPRTGLSRPVRRWLIERSAPLLAYVSCDTTSLARDVASLCQAAYRLSFLGAYDFYPQTVRLECLAILERCL